MSAFTTERKRNLHVARAYLAQARSFRLRGSAFAFTLLEWAGNARRRALGIQPVAIDRSKLGRWWRSPKGIVFEYRKCGYNNVQCFQTPIRENLWHPFVIDFDRVPKFLGRCEFLGNEMPIAEVDQQVRRFTALNQPEQVRHVLPIQQELFA